jgi:hypothetical protein
MLRRAMVPLIVLLSGHGSDQADDRGTFQVAAIGHAA